MEEKLKNICFLNQFENIKSFNQFVKSLKIENWYIYDLPINERLEMIQNNSTYFSKLKLLAKKNDIKADDTEIISWLDTLNYLYYAFDRIVDKHLLDDITIIQELNIPLTNKRADYVIFSNNKILIIEFSFKKLNKEYQYENKLTQAINYKELLSNLLPPHITIATFTIILEPEFDGNTYSRIEKYSKYLKAQLLPNVDTQIELASFIEKYFTENVQRDALLSFYYCCGWLTGNIEEQCCKEI